MHNQPLTTRERDLLAILTIDLATGLDDLADTITQARPPQRVRHSSAGPRWRFTRR